MSLSEDTKAIVASNLVIANALIYQEYSRQGRSEAGTASQSVTKSWFEKFISLLDQQKK